MVINIPYSMKLFPYFAVPIEIEEGKTVTDPHGLSKSETTTNLLKESQLSDKQKSAVEKGAGEELEEERTIKEINVIHGVSIPPNNGVLSVITKPPKIKILIENSKEDNSKFYLVNVSETEIILHTI